MKLWADSHKYEAEAVLGYALEGCWVRGEGRARGVRQLGCGIGMWKTCGLEVVRGYRILVRR
jgi:hypothetical protein